MWKGNIGACLILGALIVVWVTSFSIIYSHDQEVSFVLSPKRDTMKDDLIADLTIAEGRINKVYKDSEGNLTAGVGHLLNADDIRIYKLGDAVINKTIDEWLSEDCDKVIASANRQFPEFDTYPHLVKLAMLNWLFQLGVDATSEFPRATAFLKNRNWHAAALEWKYANVRTRRLSQWYRQTRVRCEQEVDRLMHAASRGDP